MKNFTLGQQYVLLIIILCLFIVFFCKYSTSNILSLVTISKTIEEEKPLPIAIEIMGEVAKPGIYCFVHEVNISEVIERAGGLKDNLVLSQECFSIELSNGAKITIGGNSSPFVIETMDPEKRLLYFIPINVNTAGLDELVVVPHIGEKTASAIINYRRENGNFSSLDELKKVSGIGQNNFKKMKDYLRF